MSERERLKRHCNCTPSSSRTSCQRLLHVQMIRASESRRRVAMLQCCHGAPAKRRKTYRRSTPKRKLLGPAVVPDGNDVRGSGQGSVSHVLSGDGGAGNVPGVRRSECGCRCFPGCCYVAALSVFGRLELRCINRGTKVFVNTWQCRDLSLLGGFGLSFFTI